jgi:hypothetical protein
MAQAQAYVGHTVRGASPVPHLSISNAQAIGPRQGTRCVGLATSEDHASSSQYSWTG